MAELSAVTGITMIGLYSWSIDRYQPLIANCEMYSSINSTLSNNLTIGETYPDIFSLRHKCEALLQRSSSLEMVWFSDGLDCPRLDLASWLGVLYGDDLCILAPVKRTHRIKLVLSVTKS